MIDLDLSNEISGIEIRCPLSSAEWVQVRELCCRTGASGAPIDRARWPFFAEHWVGPYQRLLPKWTYVAVLNGKVRGYLTGCPDTGSFERRKLLHFHPRLLAAIALRRFAPTADTRRYLRRTFRVETSPSKRFSPAVLDQISRQFRAHLHINLDASCRGQGLGRRLMACFVERLQQRSIGGVHVFCGPGPVPFYEALGFTVLERVEFVADTKSVPVFALGRAIAGLTVSDKEDRGLLRRPTLPPDSKRLPL